MQPDLELIKNIPSGLYSHIGSPSLEPPRAMICMYFILSNPQRVFIPLNMEIQRLYDPYLTKFHLELGRWKIGYYFTIQMMEPLFGLLISQVFFIGFHYLTNLEVDCVYPYIILLPIWFLVFLA